MEKQQKIPTIDEITKKEIKAKIEERKKSILNTIDKLSEHTINQELVNLAWIDGAIKGILMLNKKTDGVGTVTLRKWKTDRNSIELNHILTQIKFDVITKDEETGLTAKSSFKQDISYDSHSNIDVD
jgi:hypothetical protein